MGPHDALCLDRGVVGLGLGDCFCFAEAEILMEGGLGEQWVESDQVCNCLFLGNNISNRDSCTYC